MQDIPLFPLNTVVFPGTPLPLHIFEARYREMINECVEEQKPFGIVLLEQGKAEGSGPVKPYKVGCTVTITQVERLPDGRMFIMTVGQDRFKILDLKQSMRSFLVGTVEILELEPEADDLLTEGTDLLHELVTEYLTILSEVGDVEFDVGQLPTDPQSLIYIASSLLNTSMEKKQSLLENNRLSHILEHLVVVYEQEVKLLKLMPRDSQTAFSAN